MKKLLILALLALTGCNESPKEPVFTRNFVVCKSDDDNWSLSGRVECDSVTMIGKHKAILWIDGRQMVLEAQLIKIFSNTPYCNPY